MYFKRLRYRSYRNLAAVEFEPSPGFNIVWGQNGQGKTNLLEGIYLLGHLKSFRTAINQTLIAEKAEDAEITSELTSGGVSHRLEMILNQKGKEIRLDGKRPRRIAEIAESLRQVLFSPEEVGAVKGAPGLRRNLIDRAIFQLRPRYLENMQNYYRLLKQRNQLLRDGKGQMEIEIWSEQLIDEGARIRIERQTFLKQMFPYFEKKYQQLTHSREFPEIRLRQKEQNVEEQRQALAEELLRCREQEQQRRTTLAGPHRDEPLFYINKSELRTHGSQGQQRTFILGFKLALLELIRELSGRNAVLMLDDITSELDEKRRAALFEIISCGGGQVFVTTTDPKLITTSQTNDCRFFEVRDGQVYASSTATR